MDQFLLEIEEYSKKMKDDENHEEDKDTTESYDSEQEAEIDNLHQEIEDLKEHVQHLNQTNKSQNQTFIRPYFYKRRKKSDQKQTQTRYFQVQIRLVPIP